MKEKCCANCLYFREEYREDSWYNNYHCDLLNLHNGEVAWPSTQFCGDENWRPVKLKQRFENLEKLDL